MTDYWSEDEFDTAGKKEDDDDEDFTPASVASKSNTERLLHLYYLYYYGNGGRGADLTSLCAESTRFYVNGCPSPQNPLQPQPEVLIWRPKVQSVLG